MRFRRTVLATAGALVAALLATACTTGGSTTSGGASGTADTGTLTIGTMSSAVSLDPQDAGGATMPYFQAVYDTLLLREPDGTFSPMLATDWSWDDTRTRFTLLLAEGVEFTDGEAFDAEVVRTNIERFRTGTGQSATQAEQITDIEVLGDHEIVLVLAEPDPALEWALSDGLGVMASPAAIARGDLATNPVGTGPYVLDTGATAIGTSWVYERNVDYWREPLPFDSVKIVMFDNENALVNGLRTGQISTAVLQTADQMLVAEGDDSLTAVDTSFDFQGLLLLDRDGAVNPALAEPGVRQALNHAIDRDLLLEQVRDGRGDVTSQVFGESTVGFDPELDRHYTHDAERARELLADAGYPDGIELELPVMRGITSDALTSALTSQMAEAGITLTWDTPENAIAAVFRDHTYVGAPMNLGQSDNPWLVVQTLVLPGTFNPLATSSPELDAHVSALRTSEGEAAVEAATAINRFLVDEGWFVPFFRMTYSLVTVDGVTAVPQSGMAVPSLYNYAPTAG